MIIIDDGIPIGFDDIYGSIQDGNDYFDQRLNTDSWDSATDTDKLKALHQATRAIDRLNYVGTRTDDNQNLQFPRDGDTDVPRSIVIACYEEALQLLDGIDPVKELNNTGVKLRVFASVRTMYTDDAVKENVRAGIMSPLAWSYLIPYLRDPQEINLTRVN